MTLQPVNNVGQQSHLDHYYCLPILWLIKIMAVTYNSVLSFCSMTKRHCWHLNWASNKISNRLNSSAKHLQQVIRALMVDFQFLVAQLKRFSRH